MEDKALKLKVLTKCKSNNQSKAIAGIKRCNRLYKGEKNKQETPQTGLHITKLRRTLIFFFLCKLLNQNTGWHQFI